MEKSNGKKKIEKDKLYAILYVLASLVVIAGFVYGFVHDRLLKEKYGEAEYEFVITDMYEDLGSTYHLVGGRATEQKYHVVYKYRVTNRPNLKDNMVWYSRETTVSASRYRRYRIGQTMYNDSSVLPYY